MGLKEYGEGSKERLIETFRAGQDYSEQILKQLNFQGEINSTIDRNIKPNLTKINTKKNKR